MRLPLVAFAVVLVACGSDSSTSSTGPGGPSYANISGSFSGPISSTSGGFTLVGTLSLTIVQNGGSISGTDAVVGTIDGTPLSGTGTFTGTIAAGNNPSVNVTVANASCPNNHTTYSGSYDSANQRLTVAGPFNIYNPNCTIAITYTLTLVLTK